jgi:hypothetical protein
MNNKHLALLLTYAGLMTAVYSIANAYTPKPVEWVTVSLPNPPAPLPDPPVTSAALSNPSTFADSPTQTIKD